MTNIKLLSKYKRSGLAVDHWTCDHQVVGSILIGEKAA